MSKQRKYRPRMIEGKPLEDATKPFTLSIRTTDIKYGIGTAPDACAAAIACVRQLEAVSARVHPTRTYVEYDDKWVRYETPMKLRTQINKFDRGGQFRPDTYHLTVPQHVAGTGHSAPPKHKRAAPDAPKRIKPKRLKAVRERPHFSRKTVAPAFRQLGSDVKK